jgi:hypothetical protein
MMKNRIKLSVGKLGVSFDRFRVKIVSTTITNTKELTIALKFLSRGPSVRYSSPGFLLKSDLYG